MSDIFRRKQPGEAWETAVVSSGGGSLPTWWTIDSTPGAESVDFVGVVSISPSDPTVGNALSITMDRDSAGGFPYFVVNSDQTTSLIEAGPDSPTQDYLVFSAQRMGFFGAGAVAKPTGVAATGPGVHAALVSLGLIAA